ncbi:carbohydrate-binding domain-containing protein, partial [Alloprevotella tannerae]|uniref:carbohydrate-binding domain-containing protein n=1 Tax=Alloprevotella tannerae TaxID=76122 RepID=UPI001EDA468D
HLLKNTYAAIVALFIAMMALPTTAQAQTEYDLEICGTQVTSDNCGDLSVIDGVEGTVKYDPDSKTLTLEGATINSTTTNAIVLYRGDLTIKVIGTNSLTTTGSATLSFKSPLTLTGGGTLNVKSQTDCAVYANRTNLTINNCTVNAESGAYGIAGQDGSTEKLLIKNATVTAEGRDGSICDFKEITLEDCAITQPAGATFDESKHAIVLNGEKVTSEVKIEPIVTKYALKICGTQVTSGNCGDLSVIDGVEGTVNYDPDSKTLTLKDAKLNAWDNCIWSEVDGLTIEVSGTNEVNATNGSAIYFYSAPATITGGSTLNVNCQTNCGIYAYETNLTIKDCIVNAKGKYGIAGRNGSNEKLLIKNATVRAEGEQGSICDFKEITLEDCAITQPAGAVVDNSQGAVVLNGEKVTSEVKIVQTNYDLKICGTWVTSDNCSDLSVIDGVEGTVKYDPDNKTLTLEGATLNAEGGHFCIMSNIYGLTIKVSGTNELNNAADATIVVYAPATIIGGGTLNAKSRTDCAIWVPETNLTIKDCIVNAKGRWGIVGQDDSTAKLLISNATVRAEGRDGSICDFKEITLEDCAITQPAGAVVDNSQGAVVLNGEIVTSEVKIEPITKYDLKICDTWVHSGNCDDLTVIDGVEGTVKYEPESKTLTLENATIKNTNKEDYSSIGLYNAIDGLAIRLIGNNTISVEYNSGIGNRDGNALTLTGNGKLTVKSLAETSRYSIFNEGTITVRNCTLEASGWVGGLTSGYWKFDHCTVRVKGGGDSEYEDLGSINRLLQKPEFIGCAVIAPAGTYWKEGEDIVGEPYYSLFGADDKVVTDWVTIADPTNIHTPIVDTNTKQGIYTLSGVKLNGEAKDLPKGIYIVNGKKVVKK